MLKEIEQIIKECLTKKVPSKDVDELAHTIRKVIKEERINWNKRLIEKKIINFDLLGLSPRERKVMELRYIYLLTYDEICKEFSVTRERIRQVEHKVLEKLDKKIIDDIVANTKIYNAGKNSK